LYEEVAAMHSGSTRISVALAIGALAVVGPSLLRTAAAGPADDPPAPVANALPFTLTFTPKSYPAGTAPLPALQGYVETDLDGKLVVIGGRTAGLHTFNPRPAQNFPPQTANSNLTVIDPATGSYSQFNVALLPPALADPLKSTNQQGYYDRANDRFYLCGGYGLDSTTQQMTTFNTLLRIPLKDTVRVITSRISDAQKADALGRLIERLSDDGLAVTGGGLKGVDNRLYLILGQTFIGNYYSFGAGQFKQTYTEAVRVVSLQPGAFQILSISPLQSSDPSHPFHRRDASVVDDIDPKTGQPRFTIFGGVFKTGTTTGYTEPIYIDDHNGMPTVTVDTSVQRTFSQYECPVITVHDEQGQAVYNTSFGGISHAYFHQTPMQQTVYNVTTKEGLADGAPFIGDVTTLVRRADGTSDQYILTDPIPTIPIPQAVIQDYFSIPENKKYKVETTNLLGSTVEFIPDSRLVASGQAYANGVVRLSGFQAGESAVIGYIHGGIAAVFPYALTPGHGTFASNVLFEVRLTRNPSAAIPGRAAHIANPTGGPAGTKASP
jgi:hypothetical protein